MKQTPNVTPRRGWEAIRKKKVWIRRYGYNGESQIPCPVGPWEGVGHLKAVKIAISTTDMGGFIQVRKSKP